MNIGMTFLRSKVARRIFLLFVSCALLPIAVLAVLSFNHVTKQLSDQSQRRLQQASKAMGMTIYERLLSLEAEMTVIASSVSAGSSPPIPALSTGSGKDIKHRFTGLARVTQVGSLLPLSGRMENAPNLTAPGKQHLRSGKTLLSSQLRSNLPSRIFMSRALDPAHLDRGILLGEINTTYLWGVGDENALPPMTELCVLDQLRRVLFCSLPTPVSLPDEVALKTVHSASGQFEWEHEENEYLASYRFLPLQFRFFTPAWTVVLSQSRADVLAPMANFTRTFLLVLLLSLWVVLLLSVSQIRRVLIPLEKLQEGTRRIAMRDFESRVEVASGDEFAELAASFNMMASRLHRQFNALATMSEIDRVVLSAWDTEEIVDTVLTHMRDVSPCDCVSVTLLDSDETDTARTYIGDGDPEGGTLMEAVTLTPEEVQKLRDNPESLCIMDGDVPHYLAPLATRKITSFWVLPIFLKHKLAGVITLGYRDRPGHSQEDLVRARQLADQVAVALSNARLIEELDQLNWGTLTALARTVDAKSAWTAGHSERAARLALKIGRVSSLTQKQLDDLHRGALLHDIGKIGVPPEILDKPGRLTDKEYRLVREHPRLGARILEPIAAYAEVIPIVRQHHEHFDGTGYPDGLAGDAISIGARIYAVADVFDALTSDRPYRGALDRRKAVEYIKKRAGSQFDPKVVQAFLEVMTKEARAAGGHVA